MNNSNHKKLYGIHSYQPETVPMVHCAAWEYKFNSDADMSDEIRRWCRKSFGDSAPDGYATNAWIDSEYTWRDYVVWGEVQFKHEKHLQWFLLKYG